MRAVITVIGKDKKGIIASVSSELSNCNINILDISQTILQEYFTMIMLVDLKEMNVNFDELIARLEAKGKELEVSIKAQHEDIFNSMHEI
ncbi:MAG: ACT domain-containing protein [Clostridiales bacterium]|uniref:ACT domain-containing protein n=1 Tax=Clostridium sp. N3C TaxID=1776758 RepID=UPI00092E1009|nr:ACT domain-containing protein [Clostridium sp. N3C]NLZ48393.1 ACT domain-containing protein [Clostridiales bacterium]SCN24540.1 Gcv operon repressor [Clostridium sp. N3C]